MATNDETAANNQGEQTLFEPADQPTSPAPDARADATADTTADATAAAGAAGDETPAPRKRASRRTAKKAAPRAAASADATADPELEASERPVRKRATRKKAADAPPAATASKRARARKATSADDAERAAAAVEELVAEVQAAGPAEPRRASEASETPEVLEAPEAAEITDDVSVGAAVVDDDAEVDETDEVIGAQETEETDESEEAQEADEDAPVAVVPSFSLLFQAPDASHVAPRRRRAAATAPVEEPEPEEQHEEDTGGEPTDEEAAPRRARRRRGGKGRRGRASADDGAEPESGEAAEDEEPVAEPAEAEDAEADQETDEEAGTTRRRRRRRRAGSAADTSDDGPNVSTRVRQPRSDEPVAVKGSTRLEAKKQRRREGREAGRRRTIITEAEFLARRESVDRVMVVRNKDGRTQMGVLEDGVLVEHYIDQATNVSMAGNIYLGRVQNVLPSMEAAFVDIGKGRNAVLYAGEVNWDAAGLEANQPKRIENALTSGQTVLVQVTKDPIGHKGARLTSQISLPGRYLVYVPNSSMTGISRKLPDTERARLKKILRDVVPDTAGVIVRTAAEGASEEELRADVERLTRTWEDIQAKAEAGSTPRAGKSKGRKKNGGTGSAPTGSAPLLLHGEPDLTVRVIRDVFNEDFKQLVVSGEQAWQEIHPYISSVAPDLADRVTKWTSNEDLFTHHRVDEQLAKAMDRKVWLPSGGSLVIDRTEAMTVVDVNTGKFVGSGGNLEETVTKNNIEAAEEIVRQLRLRDIGGIIVIDFIDMVLESNRDLVVRRLLECLGRDRTKHQVAEVTSLGLVQMTRKRVGSGLIEVFSETCDRCNGRGFIIHTDPVDRGAHQHETPSGGDSRRRAGRASGGSGGQGSAASATGGNGAGHGSGSHAAGSSAHAGQAGSAQPEHKPSGPTAAQIAAAAHAAAIKGNGPHGSGSDGHPHAFPEDAGPWAGDDAPIEDEDRDGAAGPELVELESDIPDADRVQVESAVSDAAESEPGERDDTRSVVDADANADATADTTADATADTPVVTGLATADRAPSHTPEPAPRGRRRRGRVVAPAGPPRSSSGPAEGSEPAGEHDGA
ncbi:Rne/Rng family ribonuclease [Monashia sp. NPDC004114]